MLLLPLFVGVTGVMTGDDDIDGVESCDSVGVSSLVESTVDVGMTKKRKWSQLSDTAIHKGMLYSLSYLSIYTKALYIKHNYT